MTVGGETLIKLRLTVWRDFMPAKSLILRRAGQVDHQISGGDCELQQEVFCWQTKEDPFAGVVDENTRRQLRELLNRFEPSQAPQERGIDALRAFIEEANRVIEGGQSEWTISQDAPSDDEDAPYQINPLIALKLHLEWLCDTFAGQPGISLTIR